MLKNNNFKEDVNSMLEKLNAEKRKWELSGVALKHRTAGLKNLMEAFPNCDRTERITYLQKRLDVVKERVTKLEKAITAFEDIKATLDND